MSTEEKQICPWCQTEIVWDPEIGPEAECPHCLNELGDYRSISLTVSEDEEEAEAAAPRKGQAVGHGQHSHDADDHYHDHHGHHHHDHHDHSAHGSASGLAAGFNDYDDDYEEEPDSYTLKAQELIDGQEEAPECCNCRSMMVESGTIRLAGDNFTSTARVILPQPLLPEILELNLFVCPNCFKTETYLAEPGRLRFVQTLEGKSIDGDVV